MKPKTALTISIICGLLVGLLMILPMCADSIQCVLPVSDDTGATAPKWILGLKQVSVSSVYRDFNFPGYVLGCVLGCIWLRMGLPQGEEMGLGLLLNMMTLGVFLQWSLTGLITGVVLYRVRRKRGNIEPQDRQVLSEPVPDGVGSDKRSF